MVILYGRDDLSRETAFLFENSAIKQGIKLIKRASFFKEETNYRSTISQFNRDDFDAIFISSTSKATGKMVRQLREMGVVQPVLGDDSLNRVSYIKVAGNAANNTIVPTLYKSNSNNVLNKAFRQRYKKKYKSEPDYTAVQGYDSLMLLAAAIDRAGSTLPSLLSSTLHYMPAQLSLTVAQAHDPSGELRGKRYFFKVWKRGKWFDMPAIHVPYLLERFEKSQQKKVGRTRKVTPFHKIFNKRMHKDDHKVNLLDLAQEILQFKQIGIIYENTEEGRKASGYKLLRGLAKRKQVEIIECHIAFSTLKTAQLKQALTACYGKLSLQMDALLMPNYYSIDVKLLERLNSSLAFFKIPAISLDTENQDPNIDLVLSKRSDVDMRKSGASQVYSGLLKGVRIYEFIDRLKNLPEISVNLMNMQHAGLSDTSILQLSPSKYRHSRDSLLLNQMSFSP
jgi:hypothetical protein